MKSSLVTDIFDESTYNAYVLHEMTCNGEYGHFKL